MTGRSCERLAKNLEACREKWRKANNIKLEHDGTRVLPNPECKQLNEKMQHCLKWKGNEAECQDVINALKACMARTKGVVAKPTSGDKVWADYKGD